MTQRFRPGTRVKGLPAGLLNDAADMIDRVKRMPEGSPAFGVIAGQRPFLPVRVQNLTGGDVLQLGVLGIGAPLVDPDDFHNTINEGFVMGVVAPVVATHGVNFAIALEPIADEAIGWACIGGWCWCRLDVDDAGDGLARIDDADATRLESIASGEGVPIVWKQSGTGEKWAIVNLGGGAGVGGTPDPNDCESEWADGITADGDNDLTVDSFGLHKISLKGKATRILSTDAKNLAGSGSDASVCVTALGLIDAVAENLAKEGPNDGIQVAPTDCPHTESATFNVTTEQDHSASTSEFQVELDTKEGGHANWAIDTTDDEMEYTGSPDLVRVHGSLWLDGATVSDRWTIRLRRNGTTVAKQRGGFNSTLSQSSYFDFVDHSPGTNPKYELFLQASNTGLTVLGDGSTFHSQIHCEAVYEP